MDLVRDVSELPLPKAVILGNHDAWVNKTDLMYVSRRVLIPQDLFASGIAVSKRRAAFVSD